MKKVLSVLIVLMLMLTALPFAASARTTITTVRATSADYSTIPVYGGEIKYPTFTITEGSPARISATMGDWFKKNGSDWERVSSGKFTAGTWRFHTQVRQDTADYQFSSSTKVYINGVQWEANTSGQVNWDTYSCFYINSPEIEIASNGELSFDNYFTYKMMVSTVGVAIPSFSVASGVSGGTAPYTFSKTSGPDWITVSSNGTVSGTPTQAHSNPNLIIRVTDKKGAYKEITLYVPDTKVPPSARVVIPVVRATSTDFDTIPVYGGEIKYPTFTITEGSPARISATMGDWFKKNGSDWERVSSGKFTAGTWRFHTQVRQESANYQFSSSTKVYINGVQWEANTSGQVNWDTYSCFYINSPEFTITEPGDSPTTYDLRVKVTSYLDNTPTVVIVNNYKTGKRIAYRIITEITPFALFRDLETGTYSIEVKKGNHVTRKVTFIHNAAGSHTLGVTIYPVGDITGDGKVNIRDVNAAYNHTAETALITDAYAFQCGDVNQDEKINIRDVNKIYNHVTERELLY